MTISVQKTPSVVTGFQTKSGPCSLTTLKPKEAIYFYASCDNCHSWVDVDVIVKKYKLRETWRKHETKSNED